MDLPVAIGTPYDRPFVQRRIIGIELRLVDRVHGIREEVALVPCDVRYPVVDARFPNLELNVTVHTSAGDANFPADAVLPR